tara:strand:- start:759 stop:1514 length:756 start_codon:yes stop_codon:yes gene_type:complete
VGGLAHIIEEEGIPTTQISLIRTHTEKMKPPRALAVPFELGRPLGAPNEPEFQRRVLLEVLKLLEKPAGPVLEDFPDPPPDAGADDDTEGWACPVNFAAPADDLGDADLVYRSLLQEVNLLRPWYEEAVKSFKRSAFGISGKTPEEIARVIADVLVDPAGTAPPLEGLPLGVGFKRMADDMRYFYTEAAIARPDQRSSDVEVANWLWGETTLGKVLVAIRDASMESDEPSLNRLAQTAMVPYHQRHRTRHG